MNNQLFAQQYLSQMNGMHFDTYYVNILLFTIQVAKLKMLLGLLCSEDSSNNHFFLLNLSGFNNSIETCQYRFRASYIDGNNNLLMISFTYGVLA
jgi:hypothetical protein